MKIPITRLQDEQAVLLTNIQTGLEDFPHIILKKTETGYLDLLKKMIELNGPKHSYADFYWGRLLEEERNRLASSFPDSKKQLWMKLIRSFSITEKDLYFTLEDPLFLEMLNFLTCKEILFSSFYFTRFPCTVWGNFNLSYPIIFRDNASKEAYKNLITPDEI